MISLSLINLVFLKMKQNLSYCINLQTHRQYLDRFVFRGALLQHILTCKFFIKVLYIPLIHHFLVSILVFKICRQISALTVMP